MKKKKEISLDEVLIDGVPYQIEIIASDGPSDCEAMIVFPEQKIYIHEHSGQAKSDYHRLNDLFHELTHGCIRHRLQNFHLLDRAKDDEIERLVQEIGTGNLNMLLDSPQLLASINALAESRKLKK